MLENLYILCVSCGIEILLGDVLVLESIGFFLLLSLYLLCVCCFSVFSAGDDMIGALHHLTVAASHGRHGLCRQELSRVKEAVYDAMDLKDKGDKAGALQQICNAIGTIKVGTFESPKSTRLRRIKRQHV